MSIKFNTVKDLEDFYRSKKGILVIGDHDFTGEETEFLEMVWKDGSKPKPTEKPNKNLRMKVKTRFSTELLLEPKNVFAVVSKTIQNPTQN